MLPHSTGDRLEDLSAIDATRLWDKARDGDPQAATALLPLVYHELRQLARSKMRRERPDQTMQATALVHEAYLRLVNQSGQDHWHGQWHFFAAASEAMRRILVDHARRRSRLKRGGGMHRVNLDDAHRTIDEPPDQLLALDEALTELSEKHPDKAQVVKLRYFGGLTIEEAAQALDISTATVDRHWAYARAWLYRRMNSK